MMTWHPRQVLLPINSQMLLSFTYKSPPSLHLPRHHQHTHKFSSDPSLPIPVPPTFMPNMAAKPIEDAHPPAQTLKCQTWVLKVLIHCEGCKKKVKKVLQGIDGVYTTEIDSQQHKVRVTGNVDAETLVRKLLRSGKLAELLPQENVEKKEDINKRSAKSRGSGKEKKEKEPSDQKNTEPSVKEDDQKGPVSDNNDEVKESGGDQKKKKKNKNKGHNNGPVPPNNNDNNEGAGEENTKLEVLPATASTITAMASMNPGPPLQQPYPYPPSQQYYSPPQPQPHQYGLSYSTAYPISSSSYYAPNFMHSIYNNPYSRLPPPPPPSDPFNHRHVDHDDYEAVCSIM